MTEVLISAPCDERPQKPSSPTALLWRDEDFPEIKGVVELTDKYPYVSGGYSHIHRGTWVHDGTTTTVAMKFLLVGGAQEDLNLKRMKREVLTWYHLDHKYILPLLGWRSKQHTFGHPCIVTQFCKNGNLADHCKQPSTTVAEILKLLTHAAEGTAYLHSREPPIIHGDLRPENVLMTDDVDVALCDFGLAIAMQDLQTGLTTGTGKGVMHFLAPEILYDNAKVNPATDVLSFGGLMLQALSGRIPYADEGPMASAILLHLYEGKPYLRSRHPRIPENATIWNLIEKCRALDPTERPTAAEVAAALKDEWEHCEQIGSLRLATYAE